MAVNLSGFETRIFWDNQVNTMVPYALSPFFTSGPFTNMA